jgi:ankyrin repeat protein
MSTDWTATLASLGNLPEHLREQMAEAFEEGQRDPNRTECQTPNSSNGLGMVHLETVLPDSPLVRRVSETEIAKAILKVGRVLNAVPDKETLLHRASSMGEANWTVGDLERAAQLIPNDAELAKEVSFSGGVTPAVFAMARGRPQVLAGRLLSRKEAVQIEYSGRTEPPIPV